jgi:hypothetical protein
MPDALPARLASRHIPDVRGGTPREDIVANSDDLGANRAEFHTHPAIAGFPTPIAECRTHIIARMLHGFAEGVGNASSITVGSAADSSASFSRQLAHSPPTAWPAN